VWTVDDVARLMENLKKNLTYLFIFLPTVAYDVISFIISFLFCSSNQQSQSSSE